MIEIHKLTLADALIVVGNMREQDRYAAKAVMGNVGDEVFAMSRYQTEGPAWSMSCGLGPIAIFGLSMHTKWSAVAWMIATPQMTGESWRKLMRHCRTVLGNVDASPLHRIEAHVMADWPEAIEFAQRLGGRYEGTRRKAGRDGQDVQIWAIVKGSQ